MVGKGWMELVFDRMIFPSNEIVSVSSKVVAVSHYSVDLEGKILGLRPVGSPHQEALQGRPGSACILLFGLPPCLRVRNSSM